MDRDQVRLDPTLLGVMRAGVGHALERGAQFVAPPHLLLALLDDAQLGSAIAGLVAREKVERAAEAALAKPPEVAEIPEGPLPEGERIPFPRYDTLAFRAADRPRTLYLDRSAMRLFVEGARRADEVYRPKHLVMGFVAAAVKDVDVLTLLGPDPQAVARGVAGF
jgi:hypothetical protein